MRRYFFITGCYWWNDKAWIGKFDSSNPFPTPFKKTECGIDTCTSCMIGQGDTPLGNELLWRKGVANSESYFTITNLLSSKMLTAVSINITIGMEADSPSIIGLEIHDPIEHVGTVTTLMPTSGSQTECASVPTWMKTSLTTRIVG